MFRSAVLRAARLPRAAGVSSSSIVAGLRKVALPTTSLAQTVAVQGRAVPALSQVARFARYYSDSATATATAPPAEAESDESPGLVTRFADLSKLGVHENIVRALTQGMGYEKMTPVQSMTISPALEGKDMVAQAKTGTGKTLAFLIPIIQRMIADQPELAHRTRARTTASDIRAIIMSPTRELAEQIGAEARRLLRNTGIVVQTAVGGTHKLSMLRKTKMEGCHLMVATPGRLNDLLSSERDIAAPNLSALVLDEADRMLDVGFDRELRQILEYLPNRKEVPRQTLMFSATVPQNVVQLARTYVDRDNFSFVQTISPEDTLTHEKVPQSLVSVKGYENLHPTLLELMEREIEASKAPGAPPFKAVVFLATTNYVQLTQQVFYDAYRNGAKLPKMFHIQSRLSQAQRTRAADNFRAAQSAILFSSDVTARGMDFPNVTHVIQIGLPPDRDQYIHRLGRTGRADKTGQGWVLIAETEMQAARQILYDLPIQRAEGFASAEHDMSNTDSSSEPSQVTAIKEASRNLPEELMSDTYLSFLGGSANGRKLQDICDNMNSLALYGWGLEQPPRISPNTAAKRGVAKLHGMNIGARSFGGDGGHGRNCGHGRDGGFSRDSFDREFANNAIDSSRPSRHSDGGGYRSGGRDFDRSGGGGYRSGGRDFGRSGGGGHRSGDRDFGRSGGGGYRSNNRGRSSRSERPDASF